MFMGNSKANGKVTKEWQKSSNIAAATLRCGKTQTLFKFFKYKFYYVQNFQV